MYTGLVGGIELATSFWCDSWQGLKLVMWVVAMLLAAAKVSAEGRPLAGVAFIPQTQAHT